MYLEFEQRYTSRTCLLFTSNLRISMNRIREEREDFEDRKSWERENFNEIYLIDNFNVREELNFFENKPAIDRKK